MGVRVWYTKIVCFMILGALCAFAAIMQSARLGSFAATQGIGFELRAIAAVVVGGTALTGGSAACSGSLSACSSSRSSITA